MKRFVRSGGAALCVVDEPAQGDAAAAPVVCLHAGVCDRRMWKPQIDALRAHRRVLAYDRRGFGETHGDSEPYSHVGDLIAVLDAAQIERAVLMGCSQGGRIAIDAALAHPQRVAALVLVACSVSGAPEDADGPFPSIVQERIAAFEAAEARADRAAMNELEAQFWLDGPTQASGRVGGALRALFLDMNGIALVAPDPGPATEPPPAWDRLAQIEVPTLVIWGTLDFEHLGSRMREVAQRIPGAQSVVIDGVAHLPGLERPAEFNRAVLAFLASLPVQPPPR